MGNPDLAPLLRILRTTSSTVEWNPDLALLLRILRTTSSTVEWNPEGDQDLASTVAWILRTTAASSKSNFFHSKHNRIKIYIYNSLINENQYIQTSRAFKPQILAWIYQSYFITRWRHVVNGSASISIISN